MTRFNRELCLVFFFFGFVLLACCCQRWGCVFKTAECPPNRRQRWWNDPCFEKRKKNAIVANVLLFPSWFGSGWPFPPTRKTSPGAGGWRFPPPTLIALCVSDVRNCCYVHKHFHYVSAGGVCVRTPGKVLRKGHRDLFLGGGICGAGRSQWCLDVFKLGARLQQVQPAVMQSQKRAFKSNTTKWIIQITFRMVGKVNDPFKKELAQFSLWHDKHLIFNPTYAEYYHINTIQALKVITRITRMDF